VGQQQAPAVRLTFGKWASKAGPRAADKYYGYPYPDPPACTGGGACKADKWAFYQGQCTSWVAYRVSQLDGISFTNSYGGKGRWGDAVKWAAQARALKIAVTTTPAAGSIAWYGSTASARDGHVAYVEQVNSPTSIVLSEMNYDGDNGFWVHTVTTSTGDWPAEFIHIAHR
jgi:surface antigen